MYRHFSLHSSSLCPNPHKSAFRSEKANTILICPSEFVFISFYKDSGFTDICRNLQCRMLINVYVLAFNALRRKYNPMLSKKHNLNKIYFQ
jgi:hypothetical protein